MSLRAELQKRIDQSAAEYEQYRQDSFNSYIYAAKRERLGAIQERLIREAPAVVLSWLQESLSHIGTELEKEEHQPTFDWYNEHYHELVLMGQREGVREAITLLEKYLKEKN